MRVLASAPTRLGIIGGGTDLPEFVELKGGLCISLAINIRQEFLLDTDNQFLDIHKDATPEFYKAFKKEFDFNGGIKQVFNGGIHAGIGSSAAAAVALVGGLCKLKGYPVVTLADIAEQAWNVEVNKLGLYGGKQDQYAAVYGGLNEFVFGHNGSLKVIELGKTLTKDLTKYILLFDTRLRRENPKIQEGFKFLSDDQVLVLNEIKRLAQLSEEVIIKRDWEELGKLLDEAWELKKKSNQGVSRPSLDHLYFKAKEAGAWGGKGAMGAGGGGYSFYLAPLEKHKQIIKVMEQEGCKQVDFEPDMQGLSVRRLD